MRNGTEQIKVKSGSHFMFVTGKKLCYRPTDTKSTVTFKKWK